MFFFSSRRRHTRWLRDWSSDVCSSDLSAAERYAAAVVLYEMATGKHPQYGEDPQANPAAVTDEITLDENDFPQGLGTELTARSEERRVGKECRQRWAPRQERKKKSHTD